MPDRLRVYRKGRNKSLTQVAGSTSTFGPHFLLLQKPTRFVCWRNLDPIRHHPGIIAGYSNSGIRFRVRALACYPREQMQPDNHHLRLNLGCGLCTHPSWTNVDGSWNARLAKYSFLRKTLSLLRILPAAKAEVPWSRDIFVHDIRKPLPFLDGSADAVYASHVLEYLYREQGQQLIREAFRVLATGGIVRIIVPDLHTIVREYLGDRPFGELSSSAKALPPGDLLNERLLMRWPSPARRNVVLQIYEAWQDFHSHKWMYDEHSLATLLRSAGFVDVLRRNYAESLIPNITDVEDPSRILNGAGICVEGRKP